MSGPLRRPADRHIVLLGLGYLILLAAVEGFCSVLPFPLKVLVCGLVGSFFALHALLSQDPALRLLPLTLMLTTVGRSAWLFRASVEPGLSAAAVAAMGACWLGGMLLTVWRNRAAGAAEPGGLRAKRALLRGLRRMGFVSLTGLSLSSLAFSLFLQGVRWALSRGSARVRSWARWWSEAWLPVWVPPVGARRTPGPLRRRMRMRWWAARVRLLCLWRRGLARARPGRRQGPASPAELLLRSALQWWAGLGPRRHSYGHAGLFALSLLLVTAQVGVLVAGPGVPAAPVSAQPAWPATAAQWESRAKAERSRRGAALAGMPEEQRPDGVALQSAAAAANPSLQADRGELQIEAFNAPGPDMLEEFKAIEARLIGQASVCVELAGEGAAGNSSSGASSSVSAGPSAAEGGEGSSSGSDPAAHSVAASVPSESGYENWYPRGQCTWYAKERRPDLPWFAGNGGHAGNWAQSASARGFPVDGEPEVGAVAVFPPGVSGSNSYYGHVAYVEEVRADGLLISECNNAWSYLLGDYPRWWVAGRACGYRLIPQGDLSQGVQFIHQREETGE